MKINFKKLNMKKFTLGLLVFGLFVFPLSQVFSYGGYVTGGEMTYLPDNYNGSSSNNNNNNSYTLSVSTYSADNIGENSAKFRGYVNYNGNYNLDCWFEWGTNANYLNNVSGRTSYGGGSNSCSYVVSGLSSGTTYYYRAVAQTSQGVSAYGPVVSFKTNNSVYYSASRVVTNPATDIAYTNADLNGFASINANVATTGWFEWGTTTLLGNATNKIYIGSNLSSVNFRESLSGLSPNTIYYYRAVIENSYGVARGDILSFRTLVFSLSPNNNNSEKVVTSAAKTSNTKSTKSVTKGSSDNKSCDTVGSTDVSKNDKNASGIASVIFGADGFMPDTLLEWMLLFACIFIIVACIRRIFVTEKK